MAYPEEFPHSSPDSLQRSVQNAKPQATTPDTKYSKDEVNYRPAGSSSTKCEGCNNFAWSKGSQGAGNCRIVAGLIQPNYVCDEYESGGSGLVDLITG